MRERNDIARLTDNMDADTAWKYLHGIDAAIHALAVLEKQAEGKVRAEEALRPAKSFAQWIVALDEPDAIERRTVTMTQIIEAARAALAAAGADTESSRTL